MAQKQKGVADAVIKAQMTKEIPHDMLTRLSQDGHPMMHGVFVDAQQPSCGPDTHAFRQGRCPTHGGGGIRADARRGRTGPRRHQLGADLTAKTRGMPMPTPKLQQAVWCHTAHTCLVDQFE